MTLFLITFFFQIAIDFSSTKNMFFARAVSIKGIKYMTYSNVLYISNV